jgi:hypothetical protein
LEATLHGRITELEKKPEEQNKVEATIRGQTKEMVMEGTGSEATLHRRCQELYQL